MGDIARLVNDMEASVYITHSGDSGSSGPFVRLTSNPFDRHRLRRTR